MGRQEENQPAVEACFCGVCLGSSDTSLQIISLQATTPLPMVELDGPGDVRAREWAENDVI